MKKILMLLDHEFPPDIRVENEIESLLAAGNKVFLACYTRKGRPENEHSGALTIIRKRISTFIYKSSVGALKFPFYFNFWRSFLQKISEHGPFDAVHVHDLPLARVGYEYAQNNNIPFVLDLHENWPALLDVATHTNTFLGKLLSSGKQWRKYELEYCRKADRIIVVVEEAKERLASLGIHEDKILVVSNTLNLSNFTLPETTPDPEVLTLLYAGGINRHRGLQFVIRGLKYIKGMNRPIQLFILGSGSYEGTLKEMARQAGVEGQVHFTGWKDYKEMQKYFGKSDICLIPHTRNEHTDTTIPHKIFQYMYAGKPFVASNCRPIERIAKETGSGMIYTWDDPEAFGECIRKLAEDRVLFGQFARNGKNAVIDKYNWERDAQRLISIYT